MLKRIITAICAIIVFIPICYFSDTLVFPLAMTFLAAVAVYEMLHCIGMHTAWSVAVPSYLMAVLPMVPFFWQEQAVSLLFGACMLYLILVFAAVVFSRGKMDFTRAASSFMSIFYVTVSFSSIVLLRGEGKYLYLLVFIGPWVSDTFAYFCGRLFGKHKLIPEVSPKKTVEGSVGGIAFAAIAYVVYGLLIQYGLHADVTPHYVLLAVAGAVVSVISQIGDLSASVIKRRFDVKDYGWLFPGHGGVMDRFDSVILTAPVLYILTQIPAFAGLLL